MKHALLPLLPLLPMLLGLAGCTALPTQHTGPVTAITADGSYRCSQSGVETPHGFFVQPFRATCLARAEQLLLVGGGVPAERGVLAVCDGRGSQLVQHELGSDLVYAIAALPKRALAVAGCANGEVHVLSLPALAPQRQLARHNAPCVAVAATADGNTIATAGLDGVVHVYDGDTFDHQELADHSDAVLCLLFTDDGLWSGARDGRVRLHRAGRLVRNYPPQHEPVVALCQGGGQVIAGLRDGRLLELHRARSELREFACTAPLFAIGCEATGQLLVGTVDGVERVRLPAGR